MSNTTSTASTKASSVAKAPEPIHAHHAHLLCWKSIFAGLLISIMSYMLLAALGAGGLASFAQSAIENEKNGSALATGAGVWLGLSAVISLFMGSYFAVRIAKTVTNKVGAAHGFVIASLFFILLMAQAGSAVGSLSRGLGRVIEGLGQGSASISSSPMVQDTLNRALGGANLKSDPKIVAEGLAVRLLQGDMDSVKSYYAYQTGLSGTEVDAKVSQLKADFDHSTKVAAEKAAEIVSDTGWTLFVTFMVGLLSALIGGRIAAHANVDRPLAYEDQTEDTMGYRSPILATERGSALPYLFAWLLGVPTSLLFLIFILRSVF